MPEGGTAVVNDNSQWTHFQLISADNIYTACQSMLTHENNSSSHLKMIVLKVRVDEQCVRFRR
jgi:hypothetical protein